MENETTADAQNVRYLPTDEDRRRDALYHASTILGPGGHDPKVFLDVAREVADFVKNG